MPSKKKQSNDQLAKARRAAEQFGARIGILMNLAGLSPEIEERIFASLSYLSLKDMRRVHDALETRIVMQTSRKAYARFENDFQRIVKEYQEKQEQAAVDALNDGLASELEEEYA